MRDSGAEVLAGNVEGEDELHALNGVLRFVSVHQEAAMSDIILLQVQMTGVVVNVGRSRNAYHVCQLAPYCLGSDLFGHFLDCRSHDALLVVSNDAACGRSPRMQFVLRVLQRNVFSNRFQIWWLVHFMF